MKLDSRTLQLLDAFALRTRRAFYGARQGSHRSQRRGHGVEFAEYRSYEIGDNPRAIDWNLYARSDKVYVKRYLEEETVTIFIVLDGSRSLTHPALKEKWESAAHLAMCASYIGLASHDPVSISILGGPQSPVFWGPKSFGSLTTFLTEATTMLVEGAPSERSIVENARLAATRVRFPGICLFISDFLYPLEDVAAMLSPFRARNMEIHAIQLLGLTDIDPAPESDGATLVDSETGRELGLSLDPESRTRYHEALSQHTSAIREHCLGAHIEFVSARVNEPLSEHSLEILRSMGLFV